MWLTAFVLNSFAEAQKYILIDDIEIHTAIEWIILHQVDREIFLRYIKDHLQVAIFLCLAICFNASPTFLCISEFLHIV